MAIEQFACQLAGAHCIVGVIAAGGIGQQGEQIGWQEIKQIRLAFVLAQVGAAQRDRDDFGASRIGGQAGLGEIGEFAGAGQQA